MSWAGKTPSKDEWRDILEKHARWARGEAEGQRADLQGANLQGADLRDAYLRDAYLRGADLQGADLRDAYLQGANLQGADLRDAYLRGADLRDAYLRDAYLQGADLQGANLQGANLRGADLRDAKNLRLPTGETWEQYLAETVPALLTAAGKSLESYKAAWECHSWDNCPMAHAFDVHTLEDVPLLLRPRAEQFVQLFDAKQIPWAAIEAAIARVKPGNMPEEAR